MTKPKLEADYKRELVKKLQTQGHYARRIEDAYSVGFPDLVIKLKGWPICVIEGKRVTGQQFGPTDLQLIQLQGLHEPPHAFGFVLGFKEDLYYLHTPAKICTLSQCTWGTDFTLLLTTTMKHIIQLTENDK